MNTTQGRRLTLADGLILIAAVAVGFGISRIEQAEYRRVNPTGTLSVREMTVMSISCPALLVMLALIPLRLRGPRPPMRRLRRQPGFVASAAIVFQIAVLSLMYAFGMLLEDSNWRNVNILYWIAAPQSIGGAIAAAWFVLAVSGGWRPEASWIDRLGRVLGIIFITVYVAYWLILKSW